MSCQVCLSANSFESVGQGGHRWVFLNWALGLRALGCDVTWLESVRHESPDNGFRAHVKELKRDLEPYVLAERIALCPAHPGRWNMNLYGCLNLDDVAGAELLLNFNYSLPTAIIRRFRRSAVVDIDPGLLQLWIHTGRLTISQHDTHFTIGETVGMQGSGIPDLGVKWHRVAPCVSLDWWKPSQMAHGGAFTTVVNWWAGAWLDTDRAADDKRAGFLPFLDLPRHTKQPLELALDLGSEDCDVSEEEALRRQGWRVRHASSVASAPWDYQRYVQQSLGEFSCAKPACLKLQNAWISDRTVCYLASGRPAVVQHTGPSAFLPEAEGLFRFRNMREAVAALDGIGADYGHHSRFARSLAEEHFDARKVVGRVLECAL